MVNAVVALHGSSGEKKQSKERVSCVHFFNKCQLTFPSRLSCCISCSLLPIPMKAHGWASCSVQPSFSILSSFFCQPLPIRYTHGGGQKNLIDTKGDFNAWKHFCIRTHTKCYFKRHTHTPFLIAVRLLCNFGVQYEHRLIVFTLQVIPHRLPGKKKEEVNTSHSATSTFFNVFCRDVADLPRQTLGLRSLTKLPAKQKHIRV